MALNIYLASSQTLLQESLPVWVTHDSHNKNITWPMVSKESKVAGEQKLTDHKQWCWQQFERYHCHSFWKIISHIYMSILWDWNLVCMPSTIFVQQQFKMVNIFFFGGETLHVFNVLSRHNPWVVHYHIHDTMQCEHWVRFSQNEQTLATCHWVTSSIHMYTLNAMAIKLVPTQFSELRNFIII
jgi:hypothetical protein